MTKKIFHISRKQRKLNRLKPKGVIKYYLKAEDTEGIYGYIDNICKRYDIPSGDVESVNISKVDIKDRSMFSLVLSVPSDIKNTLRESLGLRPL